MTTTPWENESDSIFHNADTRPNTPAVIEGGATVTYLDLATLVGKASVYLKQRGIRPGDRVALSLANSTDHLILLFALARIGATAVESPLFAKGDARLAALVRKFAISTMFIESDGEAPAGTACIPVAPGWRRDLDEITGDHRYVPGDDEPAVIRLTSGSTGLPKGAIITHRQLWHRHLARTELLERGNFPSAEEPSVFLLTSSISFGGFAEMLRYQICAGNSIVILPEYLQNVEFVRAIASWDDAICFATANMCRAFLAFAPMRGLLFPGNRGIIGTGVPLHAKEKLALLERVTPNFHDFYGASGIGAIACLHPNEIVEKHASIGRPTSMVEVEIVDGIGDRRPPNAIGHLRCRSLGMSERFFGENEAAVGMEGFRNGWYYPGDLASVDADGYIYLKGRAADVITRRGVEIFPPEVEAVLAEHPLVEEAAIVGRPVAGIGEELVAFVKLRGALSHDDLVAHCMSRLPPEKLPGNIYYVEQMPKTGAGKVDRVRLRTLVLGKGAAPAGDIT